MKILDTSNNIVVSADITSGRLEPSKVLVKHHEAIKEVIEEGHYETLAEYPNGGKDVRWVVDVPAVEAKEAWDEYEDVQIYTPYTEKELFDINTAPLANGGKLQLFLDSITEDPYPGSTKTTKVTYERRYDPAKHAIVWDPITPVIDIGVKKIT